MVCDKCGTEVTNKDKFCPKCGAELVKGRKKKKEIPEVEEYKLNDKEIEQLSQSFVSRSEKYIASIGNGYIMNYLTNKSMQKGFAFLSDKRVYFKGSCLSGTGKKLVKTNEERTVDVKNITGSGFAYHRPWGMLLSLLLGVLISLAGCIGTFMLYNEIYESGNINSIFSLVEQYNDYREITKHEIIGIQTDFNNSSNSFCYYDEIKFVGENDYSVTLYNIVSTAGLPDGYHTNEQYIEAFLNGFEEAFLMQVITFLLNIILVAVPITILIFFLVTFGKYMSRRKTLFRIEYAGGCIAFDVSFYAKAEIDDFQKQLRRAKDFAEETATVRTVTVEAPIQAPTQSSVPDDLRKYADLLKEGLISQEEYDAMKKKILGL